MVLAMRITPWRFISFCLINGRKKRQFILDIQCFETSVIILRCSEWEMTYCLKTKGLGFALHLSSHNFRIQLADCQFNLALPWDSSTLAKTSEKEDLNLTKTFGLILQKISPTLTTVHFSTFNFYNSLWKCCTFLLKKTAQKLIPSDYGM